MPAASRSAERFAAALDTGDGAAGSAAQESADAETARLTALAHRLEAVPTGSIGPRPAAKAAALAAFSVGAVELARHTAPATAGHGVVATAKLAAIGHGLLLPLATSITVAAVAVTGVGVAAHRSLPGDPFYSVKRATEDVQLHLAGGGVAGAKERLAIARTRLAEIRRESAEAPSPTRTARIASLVTSMDHDVALATGPLVIAGGAALITLQTTVKDLQAALAALPADAVGTAVASSESLLGALTTATAALPAGGLPGVSVLPTSGPLSLPTSLPGSHVPTPGASHAPSSAPTTAPTAAPTLPSPSAGPTHPPTTPPSGLPTLPTSLPSGLPTISISVPVSVPISIPSLPLPISSVLGGLLGQ